MSEDILEKLKSKEDEMEALINEARRKTASIREEALKKAKEIKSAKMKEMEAELAGFAGGKREAYAEEAAAIEKDAAKRAGELKEKGVSRKDEAVKAVVRFINEGLGER